MQSLPADRAPRGWAPAGSVERFYVGSLPMGTTEEALRDAIATTGVGVGYVEMIRTAATGLSRGFAFVDAPRAKAGDETTLSRLRSARMDGHPLTVTPIPPQNWRAPAVCDK